MKTLEIMAAAVLAATTVPAQASQVGVFDSRAIVVAYYRSPQWAQVIQEKRAEQQEAKRRNDTAKANELEKWGQAQQEVAHKQLFGEAPLTNILQALEPAFQEVGRAAQVERIVPDSTPLDATVTRVDVTERLVAWLHADDKTRKVIQEVQEQAPKKEYRKKLAEPAEIQGFLCRSGWAWFYADGHLKSCTVGRDTPFGETVASDGSWIVLTAAGQPKYLSLRHDTRIRGYLCRGSMMGSEGTMTGFYPSGKLQLCWLVEDEVIDNVPCSGGGAFTDIFTGSSAAYFYEDGRLKSCKLSRDFGGQKGGQRYEAPPAKK